MTASIRIHYTLLEYRQLSARTVRSGDLVEKKNLDPASHHQPEEEGLGDPGTWESQTT
jgi:hypothetical protein